MNPLRRISAIALTVSLLGFPQLSYAQGATQKLFFESDMVRGAGSAQPACVLNSPFRRNEAVVWRVRVLDQTGKRLDDKGLKSVDVELSNGQKFPMHYGPHPWGRPTTTSGRAPGAFSTITRQGALPIKFSLSAWTIRTTLVTIQRHLSELTVIPQIGENRG